MLRVKIRLGNKNGPSSTGTAVATEGKIMCFEEGTDFRLLKKKIAAKLGILIDHDSDAAVDEWRLHLGYENVLIENTDEIDHGDELVLYVNNNNGDVGGEEVAAAADDDDDGGDDDEDDDDDDEDEDEDDDDGEAEAAERNRKRKEKEEAISLAENKRSRGHNDQPLRPSYLMIEPDSILDAYNEFLGVGKYKDQPVKGGFEAYYGSKPGTYIGGDNYPQFRIIRDVSHMVRDSVEGGEKQAVRIQEELCRLDQQRHAAGVDFWDYYFNFTGSKGKNPAG